MRERSERSKIAEREHTLPVYKELAVLCVGHDALKVHTQARINSHTYTYARLHKYKTHVTHIRRV